MDARKKALNDLFIWVLRPGTNFTHQLFNLIAKADSQNYAKLRCGFPEEVALYEEWQSSSGEWTIFARHWLSLEEGHQRELNRILESKNLARAYRDEIEVAK